MKNSKKPLEKLVYLLIALFSGNALADDSNQTPAVANRIRIGAGDTLTYSDALAVNLSYSRQLDRHLELATLYQRLFSGGDYYQLLAVSPRISAEVDGLHFFTGLILGEEDHHSVPAYYETSGHDFYNLALGATAGVDYTISPSFSMGVDLITTETLSDKLNFELPATVNVVFGINW